MSKFPTTTDHWFIGGIPATLANALHLLPPRHLLSL
jgi:hypothetical protein